MIQSDNAVLTNEVSTHFASLYLLLAASVVNQSRSTISPSTLTKQHCASPSQQTRHGATATFMIPLLSVFNFSNAGRVGRDGVGLTCSGLRLDGPDPVDAILGAHTLAPFDDCGGHVNLHAGYHIHTVTGCHDLPPETDGHAAMIGG